MGTASRSSRRKTRAAVWIALPFCALALIVGGALLRPAGPGTRAAEPPPDPAVTAQDEGGAAGTALEVLDALPVKGRSPKTGYDRVGKFGTAWLDVDRNGCDTRNDILQRDLTGTRLSGPCKVLSGTLADRYTGRSIDFVRGNATSTLVQIDHVVALSNAWQTGAQLLTQERRIALANDPLNLMAADGSANSAKGDADAASWLPGNKSFRCEYVARQISVKARYALWVTRAEKGAMTRVLKTCPEQRTVGSKAAAEAASRAQPRG